MNTVNMWATIATIHLGFVGQLLFVFLYSSRPWRQYRITRALMTKSVAFLMIFTLSEARLWTRGLRTNVDDTLWLIIFQLALDALIVFAVWYQTVALFIEIRRGQQVPFIGAEVKQ